MAPRQIGCSGIELKVRAAQLIDAAGATVHAVCNCAEKNRARRRHKARTSTPSTSTWKDHRHVYVYTSEHRHHHHHQSGTGKAKHQRDVECAVRRAFPNGSSLRRGSHERLAEEARLEDPRRDHLRRAPPRDSRGALEDVEASCRAGGRTISISGRRSWQLSDDSEACAVLALRLALRLLPHKVIHRLEEAMCWPCSSSSLSRASSSESRREQTSSSL